MAKLKRGILGPISGLIGPIVGATWKSIAYIRERPKPKTKKRKRSPAQLANEQRFKYIQQWLVPFYPYLAIGFANVAQDKTEINAAFSANYKEAFSGSWPDILIDYAKLSVSTGKLPGLQNPMIKLTTPDTIELTWERRTDNRGKFDDQLMLVLYCPELKEVDGFIGGTLRNALKCSHHLRTDFIGKTLEAYVSVNSSNRKNTANSVYLGRIVL